VIVDVSRYFCRRPSFAGMGRLSQAVEAVLLVVATSVLTTQQSRQHPHQIMQLNVAFRERLSG
jgi:hypothetical protein